MKRIAEKPLCQCEIGEAFTIDKSAFSPAYLRSKVTLSALPLGVKPLIGKIKAAKTIITVDGCPFECVRKTVEKSGFTPTKSIDLVRDIGMEKKALHENISKNNKGVMEYISDNEVK